MIFRILVQILTPVPLFQTLRKSSAIVFTSSSKLFHLSVMDCTTASPSPALFQAFVNAPEISPMISKTFFKSCLMFPIILSPVPFFHTLFHDSPIETKAFFRLFKALLMLSKTLFVRFSIAVAAVSSALTAALEDFFVGLFTAVLSSEELLSRLITLSLSKP